MNRAERRRRNRNGAPPVAGVWASNAAFCQTGYGTQTKQVVSRMIKDRHSIAVACNYGLEGISSNWEGIEHFPKSFDAYSQDMVHAYFTDWSRQHPNNRHHVFTLYDVWVFKHPRWDEMPVSAWTPIDHLPIPGIVMQFLQKPNVHPIAMSKYGADQMSKAQLDHSYIPHGIETNIFQPTAYVTDDLGVRKTGRELMGFPDDAFIVGIVNANKGTTPIRKAFDAQLLAFAMFAEQHDDAVLYLHTERFGGMGGIPFDPLLTACGIPEEKYKFVNQYQSRLGFPQNALASIYTGLDCLLAPTLGEGFGLTVAEAQACELPVIVNNFSAQPELVGDGIIVAGQPIWDPNQMGWLQMPLVGEIVKALEAMYERRGQRAEAGRKHILENYDADTVYEHMWRPLLEDLP